MNTGTSISADEARNPANSRDWLPEIAVFVAAIIGRLPTMGAWWNQTDWTYLAGAAGLKSATDASGWPARWLSQHLYWDLTWPLFGLNSEAHAIVRLVLHGLAAVLVVRIAHRSGLGKLSRLVAGLIFAASPLAFTPLYWASGIQEILAAVFALAAVDRWLAGTTGGRRQLAWATVLAVLSIFSKESGLGLPVLFLIFAWQQLGVRLEDKMFAWAMIMLLLPVAVGEGALVLDQFSTGATAGYATGGLGAILSNLGIFGWWLTSPSPILAGKFSMLMTVAGGLLFLVWAAWGVVMWRRQSPLVALSLVAALLVLAPILPLKSQAVPYLAYLAVAPLGLLVGAIVQQLASPRLSHLNAVPLIGFLALAAMAGGFFGMEARLKGRNELGLLADPVARTTALSWAGCRTIEQLQNHPGLNQSAAGGLTHLVLLQPLVEAKATDLARSLGERWTQPSDMYQALGGTRGPRLIMNSAAQVVWSNGLMTPSSKSVVLCETATGFRLWGKINNALLYAALTDIGLGHFERARNHLLRAGSLNEDQVMFIYDEGQMVVPLPLVLQQKEAFIDWTLGLLDLGVPLIEVAGLQDTFFNLLASSTGQSLDKLTEGSHLLAIPNGPEETPPQD